MSARTSERYCPALAPTPSGLLGSAVALLLAFAANGAVRVTAPTPSCKACLRVCTWKPEAHERQAKRATRRIIMHVLETKHRMTCEAQTSACCRITSRCADSSFSLRASFIPFSRLQCPHIQAFQPATRSRREFGGGRHSVSVTLALAQDRSSPKIRSSPPTRELIISKRQLSRHARRLTDRHRKHLLIPPQHGIPMTTQIVHSRARNLRQPPGCGS